MALLTQKRAILGDLCQNMALAPAKTPTEQRCQHKKMCLFGVQSWWHQKNLMVIPKILFMAQKPHFWPNNVIRLGSKPAFLCGNASCLRAYASRLATVVNTSTCYCSKVIYFSQIWMMIDDDGDENQFQWWLIVAHNTYTSTHLLFFSN